MGIFLLFEIACSSFDRISISEPHAALPSVPLSTKMKCVWCGLSGAPSTVAGVGRYCVTRPPTPISSAQRSLTTPHGKTPTTGSCTW